MFDSSLHRDIERSIIVGMLDEVMRLRATVGVVDLKVSANDTVIGLSAGRSALYPEVAS